MQSPWSKVLVHQEVLCGADRILHSMNLAEHVIDDSGRIRHLPLCCMHRRRKVRVETVTRDSMERVNHSWRNKPQCMVIHGGAEALWKMRIAQKQALLSNNGYNVDLVSPSECGFALTFELDCCGRQVSRMSDAASCKISTSCFHLSIADPSHHWDGACYFTSVGG